MNLASCLQISGKKCLAMSRKLEFDNYAPMETKFRIQVIFDIQRHECVHKCLTHGNECASVIVNDYCCCWLLRCYMNSRFVQKGFLVKWIGWHYYANDNGKSMEIKYETEDIFITLLIFTSIYLHLFVGTLLFS